MTIIAESTNAADAKEKAKAWLGAHPEFSERDLVLDVIRAEGGNVFRYRLARSAAADHT